MRVIRGSIPFSDDGSIPRVLGMMRPVFISHAGLWSAAGASPEAVSRSLWAGQTSTGRLAVLTQDLPYAFAADPALPCRTRLAAGLDAAGAQLELATLPPSAPLLIGSSSLLIGSVEEGPWPPAEGVILPMDDLDDAVRAHWGLNGPVWIFSSACTSSAQALDAAVRLIGTGACEEALVVGVELKNLTALAGFTALQLLSFSGSRPLDATRDGMVLGEAIAALRLSAKPSPWRIFAPTLALDASSPTGPAPDGSSTARVIQAALAEAECPPGELSAIKLQATGSPLADAVEAKALRQVFGTDMPSLISLKAALGHTLGACAAAELAALIQCGEAGFLPPTAGFQTIDPELGLAPLTAPLPWPKGRLLLNIQGFGGSLASWVVERR